MRGTAVSIRPGVGFNIMRTMQPIDGAARRQSPARYRATS